ncbi:hypothetical protein T03_16298 [Trichinella britovi]|uniref:Uncharacterized protein n=1 Tax=Trichinella britovi TaxID=45882 RepID=A0A0V1CMU7_TRIBR|nr:hypothetical protein T03_16298 [Trichinella britovi]
MFQCRRLNLSSAILALITNNKCVICLTSFKFKLTFLFGFTLQLRCSYYLYIIEHKWSKQSSSSLVEVSVVLIAIGFRSC